MLEKMKKGLVSRLKKTKLNKKGFTLVELIVVIAIIAVLMAILVPTVTGYVNDARVTAANANARQVFSAAQTYLTKQEAAGAAASTVVISTETLKDYLGSNFKGYIYVSKSDYQATAAWWSAQALTTGGTAPDVPKDGKIGSNIVGYYAQ